MQQTIVTAKRPLQGTIKIPGSKEISHRALLLAALADGMSEITNLRVDDDIETLINALRQLGIVIQLDTETNVCVIAGCGGKFPKSQTTVWCGNSIMTAGNLIATCSTSPCVYYFDGTPELRKQSFSQLLKTLSRQGTQIIPNDQYHAPFTLLGSDSFEGGSLVIDDEIKNEAASALLIASPFARSPLTFIVNDAEQQPYMDMTCSLMADFGVLVHRLHQGQYTTPVPQRYKNTHTTIEPDFMLTGLLFAAAALTGGTLSIQRVKPGKSHQPQRKIFTLLEKMGCSIQESGDRLTAKGAPQLSGIDVSLKTFSTSFLTICAIAPFASSATRLTRSGKISSSESELIQLVKKELTKLNIQVESGHDWIKIFPSKPIGGTVDSHKDYRIAMAFSLIGLRVPHLTISDSECCDQCWPGYFKTLEDLANQARVC